MSPEPRKKLHPVIKIAIALAVLAGVGLLFVRSVKDARSEPYEMDAAHLSAWTIAVAAADDPSGAALSLRPPAALPHNLFRQLFSRQMESLSTPTEPGIVLARAIELRPGVTSAQLLELARASGLDRATLTPRCVGYRRVSSRGATRQLYFVWFSSPQYDAFREGLATLATPSYQANALSPVMLTAAEPDFAGWQPVVVDESADCVAPVTVR